MAGGWGGNDSQRGGILAIGNTSFTINSNLDFTYRENEETEIFRYRGVSAVGSLGNIKLLGKRISINAIGKNKQNYGLGIFALTAYKKDSGNQAEIFLNAKNDGSTNDYDAEIQVNGAISTGLAGDNFTRLNGGKIYANLTGSNSYLHGNIYSGRYGGDSKVVANFINGASMEGDVVLLGSNGTTQQEPYSKITFSSNSRMYGNIVTLSDNSHLIAFDYSEFVGSIHADANNREQILETTQEIVLMMPLEAIEGQGQTPHYN